MTLKEKIELAWKNKGAIAEGFYNNYISMSDDIRIEAARRLTICSSNQCGYYDSEGRPENAVIPGKPSCSICKCNAVLKTSAMSVHCALLELQIKRMKQLSDNGEIAISVDENNEQQCRQQIKDMQSAGIDLGPDPLWDNITDKDQDDEINRIQYAKQFENKK